MPEFVQAIPLASLREGDIVPAKLQGHYLAFYLLDGRPYCTDDLCTHEDNMLSEGGYIDGDEVECAYHGARFNVKTGMATRFPAPSSIRSYPVQVQDGYVFVALS
jgi:nitrite reductase/ring-hydroxylating ferredoxin subunit